MKIEDFFVFMGLRDSKFKRDIAEKIAELEIVTRTIRRMIGSGYYNGVSMCLCMRRAEGDKVITAAERKVTWDYIAKRIGVNVYLCEYLREFAHLPTYAGVSESVRSIFSSHPKGHMRIHLDKWSREHQLEYFEHRNYLTTWYLRECQRLDALRERYILDYPTMR